MKKVSSIALGTLLLSGGLLFQSTITPNEVHAAAIQSTSSEMNSDEKAAINAGYTVAQYKAIKKIPTLESESISNANILNSSLIASTTTNVQQILQNSFVVNLSQQQKIISLARQQLGKPYVWGATGPNSFDCSGLVQYVYKNAIGMNLPRVTTQQENQGTSISLNDLQAGDLLFWGAKGSSYHVAIYIGNGQYIHAPKPGDLVKVGSISGFRPNFARRVLPEEPKPTPPVPIPGQPANERYVYRMYNPNSGLHFFTGSQNEATSLQASGWIYEGIGWSSPITGAPVYRLYNPHTGEHFYTISSYERNSLLKAGWNNEGIAFNSGGNLPVYRVFNPNKGEHFFTTKLAERNNLIKVGWKNEGIGFYATRNVD